MREWLIAAFAASAVVLAGGQAFAHEGAAVAVDPTAAAPGATITVTVEGYEPDTLVSVTLEGVNGSVALGSLTTDADGAGTFAVTLAGDLSPGTYSVRAAGADDDESTDLSVTAPSGTTDETGSTDVGGGGLTYKQPTAQWVGIAIAAAIVGLAGFALVLRRDLS